MKRIANYLIALAVAAFTFTSCEDVPSPFGTVVQPDSGEEVVIEPQGSGTKSDPYNVAAALEFVSGLGADVPSDKEIYVKGFVTGIKEQFSAQYGNAQFTMSDTKEGANTFTFFRGLYLGNKKWQEGDLLLAEGDEVIVCGKVVNYKGNTPETVQNAAYTYSINGKTEGGGGGGDGEAKGTGTANDPFNIAAAIAKCKEIGETASTEKYYVKGIVVDGGTVSGGFGNVTFKLGDSADATELFTAYQVAGSDGEKLADGYEVKKGSTVIVYGPIMNYKGNTPETAGKSAAQIVTIDGKKTNEGGGGATGGDGSQNNPFNIAEAIAKCKEVGETASTEKYYIKGIVVSGGTASGGYGNVTFKLGDSADATELFTAYQVAGSDGEKLADGYEVKKGSTVIVYGPIMNYKGNTPETAGKSAAQIVTIDGKKTNEGGGGATGGDGSQNNPFNIAEAIAKCKEVGESASTEKYYIKGIVVTGGTASGGYGNVTFKLGDSADATELFTAYQVAGSDGEKLADGYEVKKGSTVVIYGPIMNYKGNTPETAGKSAAQIVTIDGKKTNAGGGGGGGSETGGDDITAAFADLDCSNLAAIKLSDGTTIAVTQEDGKSVPIYHESTKIIRIYARNAMTIDAGSKKIAKLVLSYDTYQGTAYKGNDELYGEVGTSKITPSKDDATVTFSNVNGNKIKVVNWLESGNSGGVQLRLTKITITYAK